MESSGALGCEFRMSIQIVTVLFTSILLVISFLTFIFYYMKLKMYLLSDNSLLSVRSGFKYNDQFIGILFGSPENFPIYKQSAERLTNKYKLTFKLSILLFLLCLIQFVFIVVGL